MCSWLYVPMFICVHKCEHIFYIHMYICMQSFISFVANLRLTRLIYLFYYHFYGQTNRYIKFMKSFERLRTTRI